MLENNGTTINISKRCFFSIEVLDLGLTGVASRLFRCGAGVTCGVICGTWGKDTCHNCKVT